MRPTIRHKIRREWDKQICANENCQVFYSFICFLLIFHFIVTHHIFLTIVSQILNNAQLPLNTYTNVKLLEASLLLLFFVRYCFFCLPLSSSLVQLIWKWLFLWLWVFITTTSTVFEYFITRQTRNKKTMVLNRKNRHTQ